MSSTSKEEQLDEDQTGQEADQDSAKTFFGRLKRGGFS
jgi:hypothetical protein